MLINYIVSNQDASIEIAYYDSSNILKSYYNHVNESLKIVFGTGKVYMYDHVTDQEYMNFKLSESQGKHFNSNFRTKNFSQVGEESVSLIKEEVIKNKNDERDSFFQLSKMKMKEFLELKEFDQAKANDIINTLKYLL